MNVIAYIIICILPILIIGIYLYSKDKNKEPISLLLKLFLGGVGSILMVFIINSILSLLIPFFSVPESSMNVIEILIDSFICVALIEEISKWTMIYSISYDDKEFDELYDMIIYSASTSLGFAFFENILYIWLYGLNIGIYRALTAVPAHACYGIIMGYYLSLAKVTNKKKYIVYSILFPTILHGIYDSLLLINNGIFIIIFYIFIVYLFIYSLKKVNYISNNSKKI